MLTSTKRVEHVRISELLALHASTDFPQYAPPAPYHVIVPQRRENGQVR